MESDPERYLGVLRRAFDKHYGEGSDVWTADERARAFPGIVLSRLSLGRQSRVLDVGCGAGADSAAFAQVCGHVDGIDLHAHAAWAGVSGVTFTQTDVLSFPLAAGYDLVFDSGCFHHQHPAHYPAYLAWVVSALATGGVFAVCTFKNAELTEFVDANGRLHRYFTDAELRAVLGTAGLAVFDEVDLWRGRGVDYLRFSLARLAGASACPPG